MSDALVYVEEQVEKFSLSEQIHLLNFLVVIIQSDKEILNGLNTKVVIPLTSNTINSTLRGNVFISKKDSGLSKDSVALVHQIIVVDKTRLETKLAKLPKEILKKIENEIDYVTKE